MSYHMNQNAEKIYLFAKKKAETIGYCQETINLYEKAANLGNLEAQYWMGQIYFFGLYSNIANQHNYELALHWYQLAAANEHPEAQYSLSYMYDMGLGTPKNPQEFKKWHLRALSNNSPSALKRERDDNLFKKGASMGIRSIFGNFF